MKLPVSVESVEKYNSGFSTSLTWHYYEIDKRFGHICCGLMKSELKFCCSESYCTMILRQVT